MIKIICVGKIKEEYLENLIYDYKKRISKYHKIEIIEIKDENDPVAEGKNILKQIKKQDYIVALCIEGNQLTSLDFSSLIEKTFNRYGTICFLIGGSDGLSDEVKNKASYLLSFSKLTFPHGLFRGILLEQIYRTFKINNNETYHK